MSNTTPTKHVRRSASLVQFRGRDDVVATVQRCERSDSIRDFLDVDTSRVAEDARLDERGPVILGGGGQCSAHSKTNLADEDRMERTISERQ